MRILHLLSQTELTGAEVYAQTLVKSQVAESHEVHLISERMHVDLPIRWTSLPVATRSGWQRWKNIFALRKYLLQHRIEVIHCHSRGAVRHAYWARWGLPIGLVTTLHGRQHFSWSKRILDIYGEIKLAICENVRQAMQKDFHLPGSDIRILRNPVSPFQARPPAGAARGFLRIGLLGRSSGPKGARFEQIILNCFENWLKLDPNLRLSVIVPRPEQFSAAVQTEIQSLNQTFNQRIEVLGHIPDLRERLNDFDLTLCSGRIAIESLMAQVSCFAIGEHSAPGLVSEANFKDCLNSNFGDIGAAEIEIPLNLHTLDSDIRNFIRQPQRPAGLVETLKLLTEKEFSPQRILPQVIDAYRAAIFKRHVPQWIPALMYHKVPDQPLESRHRIFVTKENFRRHLEFFKARGFQSLTFRDLKSFWLQEKPYSEFPSKPLLLTFDDGYTDNLENAQPLLKEFGLQAVIFLLGNHRILENTWDADTGEAPQKLMSFEQKKKLDPAVWEIASHGFDHLHLPQVSREAAWLEMKNSKAQLEKDFEREILAFAYPFGSTNEDIQKLCREAGYLFAVNTDQGGLHLADQPMGIFRVNIFPEDGPLQLWKKTSSRYRKYFFRKRNR